MEMNMFYTFVFEQSYKKDYIFRHFTLIKILTLS